MQTHAVECQAADPPGRWRMLLPGKDALWNEHSLTNEGRMIMNLSLNQSVWNHIIISQHAVCHRARWMGHAGIPGHRLHTTPWDTMTVWWITTPGGSDLLVGRTFNSKELNYRNLGSLDSCHTPFRNSQGLNVPHPTPRIQFGSDNCFYS